MLLVLLSLVLWSLHKGWYRSLPYLTWKLWCSPYRIGEVTGLPWPPSYWCQRDSGDVTAWTRRRIGGTAQICGHPLPRPLLKVVIVTDDVPGTDASPAAEGLRKGRRHPQHSAALSLVCGGGPGTLPVHRKALKSLLLLLRLLLNPTVSLPPPNHADVVLFLPQWRIGWGSSPASSAWWLWRRKTDASLLSSPTSPLPILCYDQYIPHPINSLTTMSLGRQLQ